MTAGKFHLPFGIWMRPSWINKMPDPPLLYGHAHGGVAEEALLPVLFDVGVMTKWKFPVGSSWALGVAGWVSQGPERAEEEGAHNGNAHGGDTHDGGGVHGALSPTPHHETSHGESEIPQVGYGANYVDNNANKMVGARLRLMGQADVMLSLAGFWARYDAEGELGITGANLSVKWQPAPYDIRGEAILLKQQVHHEGAAETVHRGGYYIQATRPMRSFEPVLRFSHLPVARFASAHVQEKRRQLALGLNYWITPYIPVKAAYRWEPERPVGVRLQWAFGF